MKCLVDDSVNCKSSQINDTLDCQNSGCAYYLKISDYYKSLYEREKKEKAIENTIMPE